MQARPKPRHSIGDILPAQGSQRGAAQSIGGCPSAGLCFANAPGVGRAVIVVRRCCPVNFTSVPWRFAPAACCTNLRHCNVCGFLPRFFATETCLPAGIAPYVEVCVVQTGLDHLWLRDVRLQKSFTHCFLMMRYTQLRLRKLTRALSQITPKWL